MKVSNETAEGQKTLSMFVEREVYYCVSSLIGAVAHNLDSASIMFDESFEDILSLLGYDDYETPARDAGWFESEYGTITRFPKVTDKNVLEWAAYDSKEDYVKLTENTDGKYVPWDDLVEEFVTENTQEEANWRDACDEDGLDCVWVDAYEHWLVSDHLAHYLRAEGEIVGEFAGLTIWGRTCTGQSISLDSVISTVFNKIMS